MNNLILVKAEKQSEICRTMGNSRRLLILWILMSGELPVHEIAEKAGSTLQNVSQHLGILKNADIVSARREGQTIFYRISDNDYLKNCPALKNAPGNLESN